MDPTKGRRVQLKPNSGHTDWVWSVAYSADGGQLVSASSDGSVRVRLDGRG